MRLGLLISWPVILPAIVTAQQMIPGAEIPLTPPGYKMLRFDEDYSYLTNQANRTDLVDPVKYIPLRQEHPLWYLTIGGELRERLRFCAEGIAGVSEGESQPAPHVQDDPIDLQFAFVDVVPWLKDDERLTLRVGRFGMSFGAGRLVATRAT